MSIRILVSRVLLIGALGGFTGNIFGQNAELGKEFYELYQQFDADENNEKARKYLDRAVDLEYPPAQATLGSSLVSKGVDLNERLRGYGLLQLAANAGENKARHALAVLQLENKAGIPINQEEGIRRLRELVEEGSAEAGFWLGLAHSQGMGVEKDEALGLVYIKRSADQGYSKAQFMMGGLYVEGKLVPRDIPKAISLLKQAADQGETAAMTILYKLYGQGSSRKKKELGINPDANLERKYLQMAADTGDVVAMTKLGQALLNGRGLTQDVKRGEALLIEAADRGYAPAIDLLGARFGSNTSNKKYPLGLWYKTEYQVRSNKGKRKAEIAIRDLPHNYTGSFNSGFSMLPGDLFKPYSLLGTVGLRPDLTLESFMTRYGFKTEIETKVRFAEMAHILSSPIIWLAPDLAPVRQLTENHPRAIINAMSALSKKVDSDYRQKLPAAIAAEQEYHRLVKEKNSANQQASKIFEELRSEKNKIAKYDGKDTGRLVSTKVDWKNKRATFRNLTQVALKVDFYTEDRYKNLVWKRSFTLSPNKGYTLRSIGMARSGKTYPFTQVMGFPVHKRLRAEYDALVKKRADLESRLKIERKKPWIYQAEEVTKPMLEGYRKHQPLVSADFRAKASCLIAKRGNAELQRYLPTKRLSSESSEKTTIIYDKNYFLYLSPEDAEQWELPETRYQVLLRRAEESVALVNLLPAGDSADILDCGCVNYSGGKYYIAMVKPQTRGYGLKILMSVTNGDKPEFLKSEDPDFQSHLTAKLALAWDN